MLPPGPKTPAFWQTFGFALNPRRYSRRVLAQHGSAVRFLGLNGNGVAVSDPELARQVFATDPEKFETPSVLGEVFGIHSVLATSGAPHKRQRKLLNPHFHSAEVRALATTMKRVIDEHSSALAGAAARKDVVVMADFAQALTLDVILETVFGAGEIDRPEGRDVLRTVIRAVPPVAIFSSFLRTKYFPPWNRFLKARAAFDAWVDRCVATRRASGNATGDLLGMLLASRYEDGSEMSGDEIRDLIFALLIAGHETTAVAIAWGVYFWVREPACAARLREELAKLAPGAPPEALARVPYLDAFVKETMRMEPILSDVPRMCREPVTIGKWEIPKGEMIVVNIAALFDDATLYAEPSRFRPERFLEKKFGPGEFMPFGGGNRRCLGAAFAEMELAIALATLTTSWDLTLADAEPERSVRRNVTMGPARGVRVNVAQRQPR